MRYVFILEIEFWISLQGMICLTDLLTAPRYYYYYFLYSRVYNARGLKTERTKTAEMTRGPECHQ